MERRRHCLGGSVRAVRTEDYDWNGMDYITEDVYSVS
jgi:hypothetical protein